MENNSAIVLIEVQNQWTKKGIYHQLIKSHLKKRNVIENIQNLVRNAREKGIKIIHAPLVIDPQNKKGWLAYLTFGKVFTKDNWKSAISEDVYETRDLVVSGRYSFDAFIGSDLEKILTNNNINRLFLCGFITDQCIAKTMRTALKKNFDCYMVSDCTATINDFLQRRVEKEFTGRTLDSYDILK